MSSSTPSAEADPQGRLTAPNPTALVRGCFESYTKEILYGLKKREDPATK